MIVASVTAGFHTLMTHTQQILSINFDDAIQ